MSKIIPPEGKMPDVNDAGRVLAQLDDWRAIMFVLMFVIVAQFVFIFWREWVMSKERSRMQHLADSFAESASKVAETLSGMREQFAVFIALSSRVEAVGSRNKHDAKD